MFKVNFINSILTSRKNGKLKENQNSYLHSEQKSKSKPDVNILFRQTPEVNVHAFM